MKFKFLVLTLCMAALSSACLKAQDGMRLPRKCAAKAKVLSKDKEATSFFGASSATVIPLKGVSPALYVPLSFATHDHSRGKSIKSYGDHFRLDKGVYLILFTGTFEVESGGGGTPLDIALQLGSNTIFINSDSHDEGEDFVGISSTTKIIEVEERTKLSVLARTTRVGAQVNVLDRSLSILKLK
jgi:hypothetical protein